VRINHRIRIPEVRVVGADGELIGVMPTQKAMELARERDLDLVEVAPRSRPPVCRIMDYGKYKYELSKRARKAKSRQHQIQMKEMRLRPKIEEHDYDFKAKKVRTFLEDRDKVRVTVIFRGREMTHPERGERILKRLVEDMSEVGVQEGPIRREGRNMVLMLIPKSSGAPKASSSKAEEGDRKPSPERETSKASGDRKERKPGPVEGDPKPPAGEGPSPRPAPQ
jgi:translation initiation factor IF-3